VAVYPNDGAGLFGSPMSYDVAGGVSGLQKERITADIDGDGDPDVVLSTYDPAALTFLLNRGDGTFERGASVSVDPYYLEVADLDGDGDLDIALDTGSSEQDQNSSFIVLLNDGSGGAFDRHDYPLGAYPQQIALADLDGDGDVDFLAARGPSQASGKPRDVAVFHNRGDGQFDAAPSLESGLKGSLVHTGDLDGDGDIDVIVTSDGLYGDRESLAIFLNDGTGTFGAPAVHTVGDEPTQLELRDLTGDQKPEILVMNYFGGSVSVLRNNGAGAFEDPLEFPTIGGPGPYMACADLDADGDIDVATTSFSDDDSIGILENITGGEFTQGCRALLRGDVNTDGVVSLSDIIMLRRWFFDGGTVPACFDAADASDDEELTICDAIAILDVILRNPGWSQTLPEPSLAPGLDPTPLPSEPPARCGGGNARPTLPLGCRAYEIEAPQGSDDLISIGDATAVPGATVQLPITLTSALEIDAVQLVISYDASVLEVNPENALSFESTYFEVFDGPPFGMVSVDAGSGVIVAGIAGDLILPGREIVPGEDILIAWLNVRVKDDAASQRVPIDLSNGPDDGGIGPYHLRNELTHRGEARFASFIPRRNGAILGIVGDQTLFVRGDANGDGKLDISDSVRTLDALFMGTGTLACEDAGDANDDGRLNISDPIFTLDSLFRGGKPMPPPYPEAGADPTADDLFCFPASVGE